MMTIITIQKRSGGGNVRWNKEDDDFLIHLVNIFGKRWSTINNFIPWKNVKQITDRYRNQINPCLDNSTMDEDEKKKICDMVEKYGTKWTFIASKLKKKRSPNKIKNFFNSYKKKKKKISQNK